MSPKNGEVAESAHCRTLLQQFAESLFEGKELQVAPDLRKIYAMLIGYLIDFVDAAVGTKEPPFVSMTKASGEKDFHTSFLANRYFARIPVFVRIVALLSRRYRYSEHIEVFREACTTLGLADPANIRDDNWHPLTFIPSAGVGGADAFNALCALIRRDWVANGYQEKFRRRQKKSRERSKDYQRYIDAWFDRLARLIVLRIDLSYRSEHWDAINVDVINADYKRLETNARHNKIFRGWRGQIVKVEYGLGKGLHMHVILLFDTEHQNQFAHVKLAQKIGDYWTNVVTKGRGAYWNCNGDTKKYRSGGRLGIGPMHVHDDADKVLNLKRYVVDYLCKMEQFLRPEGITVPQLLRRGNWPEHAPKKRGAPRKKMARPLSFVAQQHADIPDLDEAVAEAEARNAASAQDDNL